MTTPTGQISASNINTELGRSPTATLSISADSTARRLAGKSTGAISYSDFKGKSRIAITPSSSSTSTTLGNNTSNHTASAPTGTATAYSWGVFSTLYGSASVVSGGSSATASLRVNTDVSIGIGESTFYCDVTVAGVVNRQFITKTHVDSDGGPGGGPGGPP
jgi:hypothetical protein